MVTEPWQPLLDLLAQLRDAWGSMPWDWDDRMKCATATIATSAAPQIRTATEALLPEMWTATTLASAPEAVRELAEKKGGLRNGQLLFCAHGEGGMIAFGLWWPWGDGSRISGRFGIANSGRPKELFPLIRILFAIG